MKALIWEGPRQLRVRDTPEPVLQSGEVMVEVGAVGICGSELEGYLGRMANRTPPLVMGHEYEGRVVATAADVDDGLLGRRVAVNPILGCGTCRHCRNGRANLCPTRVIAGINRPGGFAQFATIPVANAMLLPEETPPNAGALVEPLAIAIHGVKRGTRFGVPDRVVVMGAGTIGLLSAQVVAQLGADVTVFDLVDARLALATRIGAAHVHNPSRDGGRGSGAVDPRSIDLVIDAVGADATKRQALDLVTADGTVVLLGLHDNVTAIGSHDLIRRELSVTGSFGYSDGDLHEAIEGLANRTIEWESFTQIRPLEEGPAAFAGLIEAPGFPAKVLLQPTPAGSFG